MLKRLNDLMEFIGSQHLIFNETNITGASNLTRVTTFVIH